jgi:hypothetical protein
LFPGGNNSKIKGKIQKMKTKKKKKKKKPCENGLFGLEDMAHCLYDSPLPMMVLDGHLKGPLQLPIGSNRG